MQSRVPLAVIVLFTVCVLPVRATGFDDKTFDQESIDALQVLLVAECFDHFGVVVCQDAGDIATSECRSDGVAGLFE